MSDNINSVLVTGGTGSFGKTMVADLLDQGVDEVRLMSRDEDKQHAMRTALTTDRVKFYIGDVRDRESVERASAGVDCIFHAAALKQVPSCEFFPFEAMRTNILGSENVIRAAITNKVKSLVCLSTDKAVFPVSAMGISKAMMEKCAQAAARELGRNANTIISCVRYGNVMYSRGSVIPLFVSQIKQKKPITVTEPSMTRFLMPLRDSVALVKHAFTHAEQGDLFVKKAPAATIMDLVTALTQLFDVKNQAVDIIGWRHSEKLYETLVSAQELSQSQDMGDYYRLYLDHRDLNYRPYFTEGDTSKNTFEDYHSHNTELLDIDGIKNLLLTLPEIQQELSQWQSAR